MGSEVLIAERSVDGATRVPEGLASVALCDGEGVLCGRAFRRGLSYNGSLDAVAVDPVAARFAAGEEGRLLSMEPTSVEHADENGFPIPRCITAGRAVPDQYAQRLDEETVRVPDVAFFKRSSEGRMKRTFSEGSADLVVEVVSPDSRNRDRGEKFFEYERAGVEEYWIVDPERRRAEFYRLRDGAYEPVLPDAEGRLHSSTLPGFFLRVEWLWNRPKVLGELGVR